MASPVGIETSGNQDELWLKSPGYRDQDLTESSQVFLVAPSSGHGKVNRGAFSSTRTSLIHPSCPGIKGVLVSGEVKDFGVSIKGILRSIAMMDIKINDKDTVEIELSQGKFASDGHIIENAEAHGSIMSGMVSRWSNQGKCVIHLSVHHRLYSRQ